MKLFVCLEFWNKYFIKEKAMTVLEKTAEILRDDIKGQTPLPQIANKIALWYSCSN